VRKIEVHAAPIDESSLSLVVVSVVAYAEKGVVDGVGGAKEEPGYAGQPIGTDAGLSPEASRRGTI